MKRAPEPRCEVFLRHGDSTFFGVAPLLLGRGRGLYLDLSDVQVMARVRFNGRDLGLLWKAPHQAEITDAVHTCIQD